MRWGFAIAALVLASSASAWSSANKKVLLKDVQTLTLQKDRMTTHRRVAAVPQLKCVGGNGCRYHQVEVMRCENAGADYDEGSIQWTCKADIPDYFKLGSTDVKCEGYSSSKDQFILKGSCGVDYRLLLTEKGEQRYGYSYSTSTHRSSALFNIFFWLLFIGIVFWMLRTFFRNMRSVNVQVNQGPRRPPWGGGGGGGGWYGGNDNDPPPPYSPHPPRKKPSTQSRPANQPRAAADQAWNPGFWSGLATGGAAGGAAGWWAGSRNRREEEARRGGRFYNNDPWGSDRPGYRRGRDDPGEGSSGGGSTHTSTGFGSTSMR